MGQQFIQIENQETRTQYVDISFLFCIIEPKRTFYEANFFLLIHFSRFSLALVLATLLQHKSYL
jgi:hypothetical protein